MAQVTVKPQQQRSSVGGAIRQVLSIDEIGVIAAMLGICIFLSLTTDTFLQEKNLISVLRQSSYIGIMAVGMVFVMSMGDTPVRGRAEIERRYANSGGSPLSLRALAFSTEGATGFILGCYAPSAKDADIGKFTLTLKKDKDGRWLIFSDMDNPNRRR